MLFILTMQNPYPSIAMENSFYGSLVSPTKNQISIFGHFSLFLPRLCSKRRSFVVRREDLQMFAMRGRCEGAGD